MTITLEQKLHDAEQLNYLYAVEFQKLKVEIARLHENKMALSIENKNLCNKVKVFEHAMSVVPPL